MAIPEQHKEEGRKKGEHFMSTYRVSSGVLGTCHSNAKDPGKRAESRARGAVGRTNRLNGTEMLLQHLECSGSGTGRPPHTPPAGSTQDPPNTPPAGSTQALRIESPAIASSLLPVLNVRVSLASPRSWFPAFPGAPLGWTCKPPVPAFLSSTGRASFLLRCVASSGFILVGFGSL